MANSDKNILITPATNTNGDPTIVYTPNTAANAITQRLTNSGAISFEGSAGQLFSINNSLTGTLFSVNDISGIPSIDVADTGLVRIAPFNGTLAVGGTAILGTARFSVSAAASSVGIIVRGNATTPGNLQEWQNSTPATLASISNTGAFTATSITSTGSISSNTSGQGSITLGDATITKQSGSAFQFGSGANFTQVVSVPNLTSTIATGTAPFTVSSTTQVANLNVATSGTTSNVLGGAAGRVLFQSAANTTAFLTAPSVNNSVLTYNTNTNAPEWDSPPLTMAVLTGYTATVTAAGTTTLTNASSYYQFFSGTTTQTVVLPVTSTLQTGWTFHIVNNSTGLVTVNSSGGNAVIVIPAGTTAMITCIGTTLTTAADWESGITDFSTYTGSGAVVMGTLPTITPANAVVATSATQAGYIGMPQNSQSGAYTLAAGDAGKHIYYTTTGQTVTIPNNSSVAFQIGTAITFITAPSVSLSIAITTDTLRLANTTTTGTRTLAANGVATAIKVTSTAWIISGNGLT
jgi:hypothetical protein